jgi:hypothetical protein
VVNSKKAERKNKLGIFNGDIRFVFLTGSAPRPVALKLKSVFNISDPPGSCQGVGFSKNAFG